MAKIVAGNLLECEYSVIAHQANCVTPDSRGLAQDLFKKFPHANTYKLRQRGKPETYHLPGTVDLLGDGKKERLVANLYAQYSPGPCQRKGPEDEKKRLEWFRDCLVNLGAEMVKARLVSVAFPYRIGCGLASGNWDKYQASLDEFAVAVKEHGIAVYVLKQR